MSENKKEHFDKLPWYKNDLLSYFNYKFKKMTENSEKTNQVKKVV